MQCDLKGPFSDTPEKGFPGDVALHHVSAASRIGERALWENTSFCLLHPARKIKLTLLCVMKPAQSLVIQSILGEHSTGMNTARAGKKALEVHDFRKKKIDKDFVNVPSLSQESFIMNL